MTREEGYQAEVKVSPSVVYTTRTANTIHNSYTDVSEAERSNRLVCD